MRLLCNQTDCGVCLQKPLCFCAGTHSAVPSSRCVCIIHSSQVSSGSATQFKISCFRKSSRTQETQSSLWWVWEKSICSDETCIVECRSLFLVRCWRVSHTHRAVASASKQANRQAAEIYFYCSIWKRNKGEREGKRETEWKFNQPSLLKGWLGARRIYSCLASSPSTHHVSLQLLTSLLHSISHSLLCVCVHPSVQVFPFLCLMCHVALLLCVTATFFSLS